MSLLLGAQFVVVAKGRGEKAGHLLILRRRRQRPRGRRADFPTSPSISSYPNYITTQCSKNYNKYIHTNKIRKQSILNDAG